MVRRILSHASTSQRIDRIPAGPVGNATSTLTTSAGNSVTGSCKVTGSVSSSSTITSSPETEHGTFPVFRMLTVIVRVAQAGTTASTTMSVLTSKVSKASPSPVRLITLVRRSNAGAPSCIMTICA